MKGAAVALTLALAACAGGMGTPTSTPTPAPTPDPTQVVPGTRTGPVAIVFASASIAPGSTVTGCGTRIAGCAGRLRMTFDLRPPASGHVLSVRVFAHATNLVACLAGQSGPMDLTAGVTTRVEIPLDQADDCATPLTVATLATIVEGTVEVAARQEWSLRYVFMP